MWLKGQDRGESKDIQGITRILKAEVPPKNGRWLSTNDRVGRLGHGRVDRRKLGNRVYRQYTPHWSESAA